MATAKTRHRIEIQEELFQRLRAVAQREGRSTYRLADELLYDGLYRRQRRKGGFGGKTSYGTERR